MWYTRIVIFLLLVFVIGKTGAQSFKKGVNLSGWFQSNSARDIQFNAYTKTDFERIKSLGCDVIRLPINLHGMTNGSPDYTIDPLFFNMLDQAITWAEDLQIHLILDNHTFDPAVNTPESIGDPLVKVWTQMAKRYASRSAYIYYEVLNEPHGIDETKWRDIQQTVISAIRVEDTKHFIVVGGTDWNSYNTLAGLSQYTDNKLIYTFHFYDPFIFTHQGATWNEPSMAPLRGVPFPYQQSSMPSTPPQLVGTWVDNAIKDYATEGTVARVRQLIDIAIAFKKQHNVPVFCGELGVYIPNSNNTDRVRWYKEVTSYMNANDISWTTWDYKGGFGLFEANTNELFDYDLNTSLLSSIGFNVPPQKDYVKRPLTKGFVLYDDYFGEGIVNASHFQAGQLDFYAQQSQQNGAYSMHWSGVGQYDAIAMDFKPDIDLKRLKENNAKLTFRLRASSSSAKFDIRFIDTKTGSADHPWRMGITIDNKLVTMDGAWHDVEIPLDALIEKGSWDNAWFDPAGLFDWTNIDRFEIVAEQQALNGISFWFDDIKIIGEAPADPEPPVVPEEPTVVSNEISLRKEITAHPNPFEEEVNIQFHLAKPGHVKATIVNAMGREMSILTNTVHPAGYVDLVWKRSGSIADGIYFFSLSIEGKIKIIKLVAK